MSSQREENIWSSGPVAPYGATARVDVLPIERGRQTATPRDRDFEVIVSWTGPPAPHFPPSDRPVQATDTYVCEDLELARVIAQGALAELGRGQVVDLRELARDVRARRGAGTYG
jgi:hypothetical protein